MTRKSSRARRFSGPLRRPRILTAALITAGLAGCLGQNPGTSSRAPFSAASKGALTPGKPGTTAQTSLIIADLSARRSALAPKGPYAEVAQAVLEASKSSAQAQLRVARLTAKAKSKNWLPQVGPQISLTSLGDVVTDIVFQQILFDNGAKKAEREFAAADVEVAAVTLAAEMNQTVHDGLKYYVSGLKARDQAAVAEASTAKLAEFERIMRAPRRGRPVGYVRGPYPEPETGRDRGHGGGRPRCGRDRRCAAEARWPGAASPGSGGLAG